MKNSPKRKGAILKEKIASEASYGSDKNQRSIQYMRFFKIKVEKNWDIIPEKKCEKYQEK